MNKSKNDEIRQLLLQLTTWQRMSGIPPEGSSEFVSLGESNAAIEELKCRLDELGARYQWSKSDGEYRLIDVEHLGSATPKGAQFDDKH